MLSGSVVRLTLSLSLAFSSSSKKINFMTMALDDTHKVSGPTWDTQSQPETRGIFIKIQAMQLHSTPISRRHELGLTHGLRGSRVMIGSTEG